MRRRAGAAVARHAGADGREARQIEGVLRRSERLPEDAEGASLGLDRTAVPMEEPRPEGQPPSTARKERTKPRVRKAPPPVDVKWRMAYVGTFTLVNADGEELITRRYTATPSEQPKQLLQRIMADLRQALRQNPDLHLGVLQDGAPDDTVNGYDVPSARSLRMWSSHADRVGRPEVSRLCSNVVQPRRHSRKLRPIFKIGERFFRFN